LWGLIWWAGLVPAFIVSVAYERRRAKGTPGHRAGLVLWRTGTWPGQAAAALLWLAFTAVCALVTSQDEKREEGRKRIAADLRREQERLREAERASAELDRQLAALEAPPDISALDFTPEYEPGTQFWDPGEQAWGEVIRLRPGTPVRSMTSFSSRRADKLQPGEYVVLASPSSFWSLLPEMDKARWLRAGSPVYTAAGLGTDGKVILRRVHPPTAAERAWEGMPRGWTDPC
jgi:hypothetical protein